MVITGDGISGKSKFSGLWWLSHLINPQIPNSLGEIKVWSWDHISPRNPSNENREHCRRRNKSAVAPCGTKQTSHPCIEGLELFHNIRWSHD